MCVGAYVCVVCADSLRSVPQDKNGAQQLHQVKRMIGGLAESVVLDLFSNLEWVRTKGFLSVNLSEARDNLCANFGEQN